MKLATVQQGTEPLQECTQIADRIRFGFAEIYIKGNHCKTPMDEKIKELQIAKTFLKHREKEPERILSDEGILLRTNRRIQTDGSFGKLKQDMQFRRYLSKNNKCAGRKQAICHGMKY